MDGLAPVSSMDGLLQLVIKMRWIQQRQMIMVVRYVVNFKRVMRLRGNDINLTELFSNNLRHKDFSLLELREQVRARCASVSCLKGQLPRVTFTTSLTYQPANLLGIKLKVYLMRHNHFYRIFKGSRCEGFHMLDKCLAEVTTAVKNFDGNIENTTAVKNLDDNIENSGATKAEAERFIKHCKEI